MVLHRGNRAGTVLFAASARLWSFLTRHDSIWMVVASYWLSAFRRGLDPSGPHGTLQRLVIAFILLRIIFRKARYSFIESIIRSHISTDHRRVAGTRVGMRQYPAAQNAIVLHSDLV